MDTISPERRSKNMSAIRSKNTKPEVFFRKLLFARGYRYSLNSNKVPGHPDLWMKKYNTAIFIHGCFWHRHPGCKYAYMPKSRVDFWQKKFDNNVDRDNRVQEELREKTIRRLVVWECTLRAAVRDKEKQDKLVEEVEMFLQSEKMEEEL